MLTFRHPASIRSAGKGFAKFFQTSGRIRQGFPKILFGESWKIKVLRRVKIKISVLQILAAPAPLARPRGEIDAHNLT
jgi:hypothetical protein